MGETHEVSARRILVAIDMSPLGSAALEAAARLATELRAELHGLFIEDINLLRLAGLPFAKEIDSCSGVLRPLDTEAMEQALRTRAEGVRQAISKTAEQTSLRWSFRISRGQIAQTMLTESLEADLLIVGRETMSPPSPRAQRGPIMFIDEGSSSSDRVFETARRLARPLADTIVALVTREETQGVFASTAKFAAKFAGVTSPCYVQQYSGNVESLLRAVHQWRPQLLVLDRSSQFSSESTINSLVVRLSCPLAVVQ